MFKSTYTTTGFPFEDVLALVSGNKPSFPFYNIIHKDGQAAIEIGLAGYTKEDIEVQQEGNKLNIVSSGASGFLQDADSTYARRELTSRAVNLSFQLNNYATVDSVKLQNGLLVIKLSVPEERKAKTLKVE